MSLLRTLTLFTTLTALLLLSPAAVLARSTIHQSHASPHAVAGADARATRPIVEGDPCTNNTLPWPFDASGHYTRTLPSGRTYLAHIVKPFKATVPRAAVLSFHGYGGSSAKQETVSSFSQDGIRIAGQSVVVAYPMGLLGPGKPGGKPGTAWLGAPYQPTDGDDITFTSDILDDLQANFCLDPSRLYISGQSNGGAFGHLLACTPRINRRTAAFALSSAAVYNDYSRPIVGCNPERAVPIISTHGDADTTVPFFGRFSLYDTPTYATMSIEAWRETWAGRNGCPDVTSLRTVDFPFQNTTRTTWACPGNEIVALTVAGMGHTWVLPEEQGWSSTTDAFVPFFEKHTLDV